MKQDIRELHLKTRSRYEKIREESIAYLRNTMLNLLLACGTVSAGSLVLLSSDSDVKKSLIIIGIIILMTNVVLTAKFLFHYSSTDNTYLGQYKKRYLDPLTKMLIVQNEFDMGDITKEEFIIRSNEIKKDQESSKKKENEELKELLNDSSGKEDVYFMLTIVFGFGFIILGIIYPYLKSIF